MRRPWRATCAPVALALVVLATPALSLDVPPALTTPSVAQPSEEQQRRPSLLRRVAAPLPTPVRMFREAPPITRSWVSASMVMAVLSMQRVVDLRSVCFDERAVWHKGEWWRLLTNFFFMGDSVLSVFFWMQIYHFWECLKVLELVKYRYEPADFVKMILCNAVMLLLLKQRFRSMIFLGSPMVMVFVYIYSRTYEDQVMNLLGFFQIRCGWLPFTQMIQDGLQTGDIVPNLLGLICGHLYYYCTEVMPQMILPEEALPALVRIGRGLPMTDAPQSSEASGDDGDDGEGEGEGEGEMGEGEGEGDVAAAADAGGSADEADEGAED